MRNMFADKLKERVAWARFILMKMNYSTLVDLRKKLQLLRTYLKWAFLLSKSQKLQSCLLKKSATKRPAAVVLIPIQLFKR